MTTTEMKNIKLGEPVVYAAADKEYSAMALGAPTEGYNSGAKLGSLFLNLIYLNELAVPVTVKAAPLVGSAVDDEHLLAVAEAAAAHDPAWKEAGKTPGEREKIVAANLEFVKANPRKIGWRPVETSVAAPKNQNDVIVEEMLPHLIELGKTVAEIDDILDISMTGTLISAAQLLRGLTARVADLTVLAESQQAILNQKPTEAPPQPDNKSYADNGKPSAADLDAVAGEQKMAELTGVSNNISGVAQLTATRASAGRVTIKA